MARAPLVMIVSQHEWASRSLDSVLAPRGYAVLRAYNGSHALEQAGRNDPDAVFVDMTLPDMSGADLTRKLVESEAVSRAAPILLVASGHISRDQRLQALEGGAWDILVLPLDAEELLLRIERYIRGKLETDRLKEDALIDALTGLYSWHGISRRISEVAAAAARYGRPLSCVVVRMGDGDDEQAEHEAAPGELSQIADKLRHVVRNSDILGRIGPREFAVVAPDTPPDGARTMTDRLRELSPLTGGPVRAGFFAVDDLESTRLEPIEFLLRATRASHQSHAN